jgi:hypothetical protein
VKVTCQEVLPGHRSSAHVTVISMLYLPRSRRKFASITAQTHHGPRKGTTSKEVCQRWQIRRALEKREKFETLFQLIVKFAVPIST